MRYIAVGGKSISSIIGPCMTAASAIYEAPPGPYRASRVPAAPLWNGARLPYDEVFAPFEADFDGVTYRVELGAGPDEVDIFASNWVRGETVSACLEAIDPDFFADSGASGTVSVLDRTTGDGFVLFGSPEGMRRQATLADEKADEKAAAADGHTED